VPVVVTGAAGFIGGRLARHLAARGDTVVALDRREGAPPGVIPVTADLLDASDDLLDGVLRGADAVFHLAGLPGVRDGGDGLRGAGHAAARGAAGPLAVSRPEDLERRRWLDNVVAAERVLDRVPPSVPLVVTSSSSVYGGAWLGTRPSRESDPLRPLGGYARSKLALERRCAARAARGGMVTVVRPFTVAGPGQRPDMAIARWLAAAAGGAPVRVFGGLDRRRDVTDVDDVVEGLVRAAERGVTGTINLGTGVGHTLGMLAAAVGEALGVEVATTVVPAEPVEPAATLADTTRCRRLLGFVPQTDLTSVVRRQAEAEMLQAAPA
jgi:nucleoside-diphosphate-sugar epimerase